MKRFSQILTLLVVIKATMSSTMETLVTEIIPSGVAEVSSNNTILNLETEILAEITTSKPSELQTDIVFQFISTKSPLTSNELENSPTNSTELESVTFKEDVTTKIPAINLEIQDNSGKPTEVKEAENLYEENTTTSSNSNLANEKPFQEVSTNNLTLDDNAVIKEGDFQINSELSKAQSNPLSDEIVTTETTIETFMEEFTTKPSNTLEDYAVKEMIFILDHILITSQEFVSKVLQNTENSLFDKDLLKRYAENLHFLLNSDDLSDDPCKSILRKLTFLKGKSTKQLPEHLPSEWTKSYKSNKQEVSIWLDKASEQMRSEFNKYISDDTDHVKYQYFNEAFDDIPRANEIHQKLAIIVDLIKIIKNKKQITFMDLYMQ